MKVWTSMSEIPAVETVVDVPELVERCKDRWYNETRCKVNDSVIRLGIPQGEYHWHKHDQDDEFFFVLVGHLLIDLQDRTVDLQARQGFVAPKASSIARVRRTARSS